MNTVRIIQPKNKKESSEPQSTDSGNMKTRDMRPEGILQRKLMNTILQRRTTSAEQISIRTKARSIINRTEANEITALRNRITFNVAAVGFNARVDNFAAFRADAEDVIAGFGNILDFANTNGYSNYNGDDLDGREATLTTNLNEINAVRLANDAAAVDARKLAMFNAVAVPNVQQQAYDANGLAFRNAATFAAATLALTNWEQRFFRFNRAQIIELAKNRADNGAPGNATLWRGLSGNIRGHQTHMTIYNADILPIADYIVTAATDRAASDNLADAVLANGANQVGIHLTAEINPHPNPNPRVFGNPPDAARHSIYVLPPGMNWGDFVAPLTAAQNAVRNDVWAGVNAKRILRP